MFTISEFSKIALVPVTLLRYYEKISLFFPAHVDKVNSYRYYSAEQLPELGRILALKELGLSLKQVSRLVQEDVSAEEIRDMYSLRKAQIEQTLHEETFRLRVVETRLKQLEQREQPVGNSNDSANNVVIKAVPAQPFLSYREIYNNIPSIERALLELEEKARGRLSRRAGHMTAVFYDEAFDPGAIDVELGYALREPTNEKVDLPSGHTLVPSELPAVETAACTVWSGKKGEGLLSYAELGRWIQSNSYTLLAPHREVMMVPPLPFQREDVVAEIQLPITARANNA